MTETEFKLIYVHKIYHSRIVGMQHQTKMWKSFPKQFKHSVRFFFKLHHDDEFVRITHKMALTLFNLKIKIPIDPKKSF